MRKYLFCLLFAELSFVSVATAQSTIQPLEVGDQVPDLLVNNYLQPDQPAQPLSNYYNNKFLILDFWATWCVPCVNNLLVLDSLKRKLAGKLEVLSVSYQSREEINLLLKSKKQLNHLPFDFVVSDTTLFHYFPHRSLPHSIWIDQTGKVVAIPSHQDVTLENIESFIQHQSVSIAVKKDILDFNPEKLLPTPDSLLLYSSRFSKKPSGITNGGRSLPLQEFWERPKTYDRYVRYGVPLIAFYLYGAYGNQSSDWLNKFRYQLHFSDSSFIVPPKKPIEFTTSAEQKIYEKWWKDNVYAYEITLPYRVDEKTMSNFVLQDLNRCLPYLAKVIPTKTYCWVIINKTKKSKQLRSTGGKSEFVWPKRGYLEKMKNCTIDDLLLWVNRFSLTHPVLNETKNTEGLDMVLDMPMDYRVVDINLLKERLLNYGFDIVLKKRKVPLLHIYDKQEKIRKISPAYLR